MKNIRIGTCVLVVLLVAISGILPIAGANEEFDGKVEKEEVNSLDVETNLDSELSNDEIDPSLYDQDALDSGISQSDDVSIEQDINGIVEINPIENQGTPIPKCEDMREAHREAWALYLLFKGTPFENYYYEKVIRIENILRSWNCLFVPLESLEATQTTVLNECAECGQTTQDLV